MALKKGDKAPDFQAATQECRSVSLKDYKGRKLALYFYPKDDTPGCTKEACNLRDNYRSLKDHGIAILGVSPDSEKKHGKFRKKYDLPFDLLADPDKKVIRAYDAWGKKKLFGRSYDGVKRKTYLIDEEGNIEAVIDKVSTGDHASQILEAAGE